MNIEITGDAEQIIAERIAAGDFDSAEDVVLSALLSAFVQAEALISNQVLDDRRRDNSAIGSTLEKM